MQYLKIFLNDLFFVSMHKGTYRHFLTSFFYTLIILIICLGYTGKTFLDKKNYALYPDGHMVAAVLQAVNNVVCHKSLLGPSYLSTSDIETLKADDQIKRITLDKDGINSLTYCDNITSPFLNNENTLFFLITTILKFNPDMTFYQMGLIFNGIRIFMTAIFILFLMRIGSSLWLGGVSCYLIFFCFFLNNAVDTFTFVYSLYPFIVPSVLSIVGLGGLVMSLFAPRKHLLLFLAFNFLLGAYLFFIANLRSTYAIPVFIIISLFLWINIFGRKEMKTSTIKKIGILFLSVIAIVVGYKLMHHIYLKPLVDLAPPTALSSHTIGHPVVLSLSYPPNDFAKEQGISWDDAVGWELAKKIQPDVWYLTKDYEKALIVYYLKLWVYYPHNMLSVYNEKLRVTGEHVISNVLSAGWPRYLKLFTYPVRALKNGVFILIAFLCVPIVFFSLRRKISNAAYFGIMSLALTGIAMFMESWIVSTFYVKNYHGYMIFWMIFINLIFWQSLLQGLRYCFRHQLCDRHPERSEGSPSNHDVLE